MLIEKVIAANVDKKTKGPEKAAEGGIDIIQRTRHRGGNIEHHRIDLQKAERNKREFH